MGGCRDSMLVGRLVIDSLGVGTGCYKLVVGLLVGLDIPHIVVAGWLVLVAW